MKFIYFGGTAINLAHVVSFIKNDKDGSVAVVSVIGRIDIPFPHGGTFIKQFEAYYRDQLVAEIEK